MAERKEGLFKINVENLALDQYNPRLYGESSKDKQEVIMEKIYVREQIEELASSLAVNGYFEEEPIIVVPDDERDFENINSSNVNSFSYVVIEGNRRTTSVKLLLKKYSFVDDNFPKIEAKTVRDSLRQIPAIIYKRREDVDTYLSVRHISGNRKWDAFAKAKYIFDKVNSINRELPAPDIEKAIQILETRIGDQSNIVKKYYIYFKIFQEIDDHVIDYSTKHIKDRFSLLEVSLAAGNTSVANYIGLPPFKKINLNGDLIDSTHVDNLRDVTEWIFGKDEHGSGSLINDSRQINSLLKPILQNKEAVEHLKTYADLDGAYELTNGEENLVVGNIKKASKLLDNILAKVPKYKSHPDFINSLAEHQASLESVRKLMK
ncbi:hypothetical protein [Pedobacter deserti]|uniref:hypothetical protein n=1 Tax=Pedobacter deserti TaxID=2817382 RepID=UPI00210A2319|nr:hypothetical protein [Pedobacter sp. SYSU D00382]